MPTIKARCSAQGCPDGLVATSDGETFTFLDHRPPRHRRATAKVGPREIKFGPVTPRRTWPLDFTSSPELQSAANRGDMFAQCQRCGTVYPLRQVVVAMRRALRDGRASIKLRPPSATL